MVRFSFSVLIVLGLMLTSYFGLAAWRASGGDQPDITGTVTDPQHLPVVSYIHPDQFAAYRQIALAKGFEHVSSGPLVRSSYHAGDYHPAS